MRVYSACYYHIVWGTKFRQPLIIKEIEPLLFETVYRKAHDYKSHIYATNAAWDHLHIAVSIPTTCTISDWVRDIKGYSTYNINQQFHDLEPPFRWQQGYGVHTFGKKDLPFVIEYIKNQKQRHAENHLEQYLEYMGDAE